MIGRRSQSEAPRLYSRGIFSYGVRWSEPRTSTIHPRLYIRGFLVRGKFLILVCIFTLCILRSSYGQGLEFTRQEDPEARGKEEEDKKPQAITINGDRVEYSAENKDFTAEGNVEVLYKGQKLTCRKLTINTQTKDATAEGDARLDDKTGTIEGSKLVYNLDAKSGIIYDANFRSNPYFLRSERFKRVSEDELVSHRGYFTTCNYDNPHYRIKSKKMSIFPGDKIKTNDDIFYLSRVPMFYVPQYNHSLRDPMMRVQLLPGSSKDWGPYFLTAWRYQVAEDISGRIYFDLRDKLGAAEGFGVNYKTFDFGKGDFKFYYTREVGRKRHFYENYLAHLQGGADNNDRKPLGIYERYLIRLRHKWDIDERTSAVLQYYYIKDQKRSLRGVGNNFLKDYFYREYEKDEMPLSYVTLHRSYAYSTLDILLQKRTNRWYTQAEDLPQITYTLPSVQVLGTPFYIADTTSYVNSNYKNAVPSDSSNDVTSNSFNTNNKLSLPAKVAFINFTPSFAAEQNYNDKGQYGATLQLNFATGADLSAKFYRVFGVKTNFLGLDINKLRHIVTPGAAYGYSKNSIMPASKLRIGGGASVGLGAQTLSFALENKLQTKRKGQSLDLANFIASVPYNIKPRTGDKRGSSLGDFLFKLELRPYSWMTLVSDMTLNHSAGRSATNWKKITDANYNINFNLAPERTFSIGQRYARKGGNEITYSLDWRLNPKWKFYIYQRRNRGHSTSLKRGLLEQEYRLARDFHCWIIDLTYNVRRGQGESIWMVFRLKAFPEIEFEYNQMYHQPKPGSQSNP